MKHIIVGILTVLILGLMGYTFKQGRAFQGGEANRIIENIASVNTPSVTASQTQTSKSEDDAEKEKLKALKDKAGNVALFKVSEKFKRKCASCHGIEAKGAVGLPLFGQSSQEIYAKLLEYKSGKRTNPIMHNAIMNLTDEDFKELAQEISEFKQREAEATK